MLHAERRHCASCNKRQLAKHTKNPKLPKKLEPKDLNKCDCPLRVMGTDSRGKFRRESLDTKDLATAAIRIQKIEQGEPIVKPLADLTIEEAFAKYLDILKSQRDVRLKSIHFNYKIALNAMMRYTNTRGVKMMAQ